MFAELLAPCRDGWADEMMKESVCIIPGEESEDDEFGAEEPLLADASFVHDLGNGGLAQDSVWLSLDHIRTGNEMEACATPPVEFDVQIPETVSAGSEFEVLGPHGKIEVTAPSNCEPGSWGGCCTD